MNITKKLTAKTFWLLLLLSIAVILFAYGCIWIFLPYADQSRSQRGLQKSAKELSDNLRRIPQSESETVFLDFVRRTGAEIYLLDADGSYVSPFTFQPIAHLTQEDWEEGERWPFRFAGSDRDYILIARYNPSRTNEIAGAVRRTLPLVLGTALFLSAVSAYLFSCYATRPIIRISQIADKLANLDFGWYCPDIRDDEIGSLSKSINLLSDRLHEALDEIYDRNAALQNEIALEKEKERRRLLFFSSVSHELKTPLAVVIGQLEGMQANIGVYQDHDKYLERSRETLESLNHFIHEVLMVAHIDMEALNDAEAVSLSELLAEVAEEYAEYAEVSGITLESRIAEKVLVYSDAVFLKKALGNIVGNAISHSPERARVEITLSAGENAEKKDRAWLSVINAPAHIDEEEIPHVFEAFYRSHQENGYGSGLGLYITKMILDAYNIPCSLTNTSDGVQFLAEFYTQKSQELHTNYR